jgi:hypothetical protein
MTLPFDKPDDIPMSVKMERALAALRRMTPAESFQLMVKAGLMTPAEAEEATKRFALREQGPRTSRTRRPSTAKNSARPRRA